MSASSSPVHPAQQALARRFCSVWLLGPPPGPAVERLVAHLFPPTPPRWPWGCRCTCSGRPRPGRAGPGAPMEIEVWRDDNGNGSYEHTEFYSEVYTGQLDLR